MSRHNRPEVSDPPMSPFHVFPSPRILFPSFQFLPPSIGQGPYPVFGNHFPHIMAKVLAKKPGRYNHKVRRQRRKKSMLNTVP